MQLVAAVTRRGSRLTSCTGQRLWYSLAPESSGLLFLVFLDPEPLLRAKETSDETPSQKPRVFGCHSRCGASGLPGAVPPKRRAILFDLREYQLTLLARSRSRLTRCRDGNGR